MDQILTNPAIQSSIIPFAAALLSLLILRSFGWFWAGLALVIGFFAAVHFITGFQLTPLNSTRKIIALGMGAAVLGLILDRFPIPRKTLLGLLVSISVAAVLWVVWPILSRKEGLDILMYALPAPLYVAWLVVSFENNRLAQPSIYAGVFSIATGTSLCALFGASALLGQFGGALAAASGAFVLLNLLNKNTPIGTSFTLPASLLSGLIGVAATVYAKLPWYSLVMLGTIPLLLNLHIPPGLSRVKKLLVLLALTMAVAMVALGLTWQSQGAPPI